MKLQTNAALNLMSDSKRTPDENDSERTEFNAEEFSKETDETRLAIAVPLPLSAFVPNEPVQLIRYFRSRCIIGHMLYPAGAVNGCLPTAGSARALLPPGRQGYRILGELDCLSPGAFVPCLR